MHLYLYFYTQCTASAGPHVRLCLRSCMYLCIYICISIPIAPPAPARMYVYVYVRVCIYASIHPYPLHRQRRPASSHATKGLI